MKIYKLNHTYKYTMSRESPNVLYYIIAPTFWGLFIAILSSPKNRQIFQNKYDIFEMFYIYIYAFYILYNSPKRDIRKVSGFHPIFGVRGISMP
jgi:hypothetical protein